MRGVGPARESTAWVSTTQPWAEARDGPELVVLVGLIDRLW